MLGLYGPRIGNSSFEEAVTKFRVLHAQNVLENVNGYSHIKKDSRLMKLCCRLCVRYSTALYHHTVKTAEVSPLCDGTQMLQVMAREFGHS